MRGSLNYKNTYSDSSKIFGNGICCAKISSSSESLAVIEDAIKCANFQHCTVSELPNFSATARFCSHISIDFPKKKHPKVKNPTLRTFNEQNILPIKLSESMIYFSANFLLIPSTLVKS